MSEITKSINSVSKAIKSASTLDTAASLLAKPNLIDAAVLTAKAASIGSFGDLKSAAAAERDSVLGQVAKKALSKFALPGTQEALAAASKDAGAAARTASRSNAKAQAKAAVKKDPAAKAQTDKAEGNKAQPIDEKDIKYTGDDRAGREILNSAPAANASQQEQAAYQASLQKALGSGRNQGDFIGQDFIQGRFMRMHNFSKLDKTALGKDGKNLGLKQDQIAKLLKEGEITVKGADGKDQKITKNDIDLRIGKSQLNKDEFKTLSANLGFLVKGAETVDKEKAAAEQLDAIAKSSQDALKAGIGDKKEYKSLLHNADALSAVAEKFLKLDKASGELKFDSKAAEKLKSEDGQKFIKMLAEDQKHMSRNELTNVKSSERRSKALEVNGKRFEQALEKGQTKEAALSELAKVGITDKNMANFDGRVYQQGAKAIKDLSSPEGIDKLAKEIIANAKATGDKTAKISLLMQTDFDSKNSYVDSARGMDAARSAADNANQLVIPVNGEAGFKAIAPQLEQLSAKLQEAGIKVDAELGGFFHAGGGRGIVSSSGLSGGDDGRIDSTDTDIAQSLANMTGVDGNVDITCAACNFESTTKSLAQATADAKKGMEGGEASAAKVTYTSSTDTGFAKMNGKNLLADDSFRKRYVDDDGNIKAKDQFTNDASHGTAHGAIYVNQEANTKQVAQVDKSGLIQSHNNRAGEETVSKNTRDDIGNLPAPPNQVDPNVDKVDDDSGNIDPALLAGTNNEANKEWETAGASS